jgi:peptidoglycan hydrolase-like protein with peptidoglycan-binding domain
LRALPVDGRYGPITIAAVKAYQAGRSVIPDGIVGEVTWLVPASAAGETLEKLVGFAYWT